MLKGDRFRNASTIGLAVLAVYLIGFLIGKIPGPSAYKSGDGEHAANDGQNRAPQSPPFEAHCNRYDGEDAKECRDKEDLKAQREMAKWAFPMFFATAASSIFAIAGVSLLARQLWLTRQLFVQDKRPWIRVSVNDVSVGSIESSHEKKVIVEYHAINHGSGPAVNVIVEMEVINTGMARVFGVDNDAVKSFYRRCKERYSARADSNMNSLLPIPEIGKTGSETIAARLPILDAPNLGLGERKFYVAVCATYKHAVEGVHQTGAVFCAYDQGPHLEGVDGSTWTRAFNDRPQPVRMGVEMKAEGSYHT